jgi:hypothetical protein
MNAGALNIETAPVDSSQIAEIGYDATTNKLRGPQQATLARLPLQRRVRRTDF